jgi:hypothetical protein
MFGGVSEMNGPKLRGGTCVTSAGFIEELGVLRISNFFMDESSCQGYKK